MSDGLQNINRLTYAHQIAWTLARQMRLSEVDHLNHSVMPLTYCEAAYSVSAKPDLLKRLRRLLAKVFKVRSLHDTE